MNRFSFIGLLNRTAYRLHRHSFLGWTLTRWLVIGLLLPPLLGLAGVWPLSRAMIFLLFVFWLAVLLGLWRIKSAGYLRFTPTEPTFPAAAPLPDTVEIPVRVSGNFSVRAAARYFVEADAFYQTFQTRERVLKVTIPFSRFLLLARSPEPETGWWYAFFTPQTLKTFQPGLLHFGYLSRPALHLVHQPDGAKKPEHLFISFDSAESGAKIIADLLVDNGAEDEPSNVKS